MITAILLEQFLIWIKKQASQSMSHKRNWTALASNHTLCSALRTPECTIIGENISPEGLARRGETYDRNGEDKLTQSLYFCWFHRQLSMKLWCESFCGVQQQFWSPCQNHKLWEKGFQISTMASSHSPTLEKQSQNCSSPKTKWICFTFNPTKTMSKGTRKMDLETKGMKNRYNC